MRLDVMQYFIEVADEKSISKVCRKRNIPQQSLSSMLSSLKDEIGQPIFERDGSKMLLTEAGKEVYQFCSEFIKSYTTLKHDLHPQELAVPRKIVVESQNNIAQTVLPRWVSTVFKYHPEIELKIGITNSAEVIESISEERAQIGFILLFEKGDSIYPTLPEDVVFHPIFTSRPYFWVNQKNPLFQDKSIRMKDLEQYKFIKDENTDDELFQYVFENYFGLKLSRLPASNIHIILQMLRDNLAIATDLKDEDGELTLAYLFNQYSELKAIPLREKDNYVIKTGYIVKRDIAQNDNLEIVLQYIK